MTEVVHINSRYAIRNRMLLVLDSIMLCSGLVKIVRDVEDTVPVSDKVEINIQRSLDNAEKKIRNDEQALKLLKRIEREKK